MRRLNPTPNGPHTQTCPYCHHDFPTTATTWRDPYTQHLRTRCIFNPGDDIPYAPYKTRKDKLTDTERKHNKYLSNKRYRLKKKEG